jgi:hypothetical protein
LVEHVQVRLDPTAPGVAVGLLLDDRGELCQLLVGAVFPVAYADADLVVLPGVERRVDVDEVYLTGQLVRERGEHLEVVAPDQLVPPATVIGVGAAVEQRASICTRRVDRLNYLDRQP